MKGRVSTLFWALLIGLLLVGCARTKVTGVWQKQDFAAPPLDSLLVLAQTGEEFSRGAWERLIAEYYSQRGMQALPAVSNFPADRQPSLTRMLEYAAERDIDGLLVIRHLTTLTEEVHHPPRLEYYSFGPPYFGYPYRYGYYRWHPYRRYYSPSYFFYERQVYRPGYTSYNKIVRLETYLYHTRSREMIWSMTTRTTNPQSSQSLAADIGKNSFQLLRREALIRLPGS